MIFYVGFAEVAFSLFTTESAFEQLEINQNK